MISVVDFINELSNTDPYIKTIYTQGGCWKFYLLLKSIWPESIPVINSSADHIGTLINGKVYDINGLVDWNWRAMSVEDERIAKNWSFSRNAFLQIGECPICEEPLVV